MAFKPAKFNVENMSSVRPVLDEGLYAGIISSIAAERKVDDAFVSTIQLIEQFDKKSWDEAERRYTVSLGTYVFQGTFNFTIEIISKKAKRILNQDTPRFFGTGDIVFDQNTGEMSMGANPILKQLIDLAGLGKQDVFDNFIEEEMSNVDPEELEVKEVPEMYNSVPNAKELLEAALYYRKFFEFLFKAIEGTKVLALIEKTWPNKANSFDLDKKADQINRLNQGSRRPFSKSGLVSYDESAEFDDDM